VGGTGPAAWLKNLEQFRKELGLVLLKLGELLTDVSGERHELVRGGQLCTVR
jgi:hypothetical protein